MLYVSISIFLTGLKEHAHLAFVLDQLELYAAVHEDRHDVVYGH